MKRLLVSLFFLIFVAIQPMFAADYDHVLQDARQVFPEKTNIIAFSRLSKNSGDTLYLTETAKDRGYALTIIDLKDEIKDLEVPRHIQSTLQAKKMSIEIILVLEEDMTKKGSLALATMTRWAKSNQIPVIGVTEKPGIVFVVGESCSATPIVSSDAEVQVGPQVATQLRAFAKTHSHIPTATPPQPQTSPEAAPVAALGVGGSGQ